MAEKKKTKPAQLPAKFKGPRAYKLEAPHYRGGRYLEKGTLIVVTDEIPSRTWTPLPKVPRTAVRLEKPKPSANAGETEIDEAALEERLDGDEAEGDEDDGRPSDTEV